MTEARFLKDIFSKHNGLEELAKRVGVIDSSGTTRAPSSGLAPAAVEASVPKSLTPTRLLKKAKRRTSYGGAGSPMLSVSTLSRSTTTHSFMSLSSSSSSGTGVMSKGTPSQSAGMDESLNVHVYPSTGLDKTTNGTKNALRTIPFDSFAMKHTAARVLRVLHITKECSMDRMFTEVLRDLEGDALVGAVQPLDKVVAVKQIRGVVEILSSAGICTLWNTTLKLTESHGNYQSAKNAEELKKRVNDLRGNIAIKEARLRSSLPDTPHCESSLLSMKAILRRVLMTLYQFHSWHFAGM